MRLYSALSLELIDLIGNVSSTYIFQTGYTTAFGYLNYISLSTL